MPKTQEVSVTETSDRGDGIEYILNKLVFRTSGRPEFKALHDLAAMELLKINAKKLGVKLA